MNTFALVIFVVMPVAGAALALRQWLLLRSGVRVSARIVGFEKFETDPMSESSKPTLHLPIVEFTDENGELRNGYIMKTKDAIAKAINRKRTTGNAAPLFNKYLDYVVYCYKTGDYQN